MCVMINVMHTTYKANRAYIKHVVINMLLDIDVYIYNKNKRAWG